MSFLNVSSFFPKPAASFANSFNKILLVFLIELCISSVVFNMMLSNKYQTISQCAVLCQRFLLLISSGYFISIHVVLQGSVEVHFNASENILKIEQHGLNLRGLEVNQRGQNSLVKFLLFSSLDFFFIPPLNTGS